MKCELPMNRVTFTFLKDGKEQYGSFDMPDGWWNNVHDFANGKMFNFLSIVANEIAPPASHMKK